MAFQDSSQEPVSVLLHRRQYPTIVSTIVNEEDSYSEMTEASSTLIEVGDNESSVTSTIGNQSRNYNSEDCVSRNSLLPGVHTFNPQLPKR